MKKPAPVLWFALDRWYFYFHALALLPLVMVTVWRRLTEQCSHLREYPGSQVERRTCCFPLPAPLVSLASKLGRYRDWPFGVQAVEAVVESVEIGIRR